MTRTRRISVPVILGSMCLIGCQSQQPGYQLFNPFNLKLPFEPTAEPVRIGIADGACGILDPRTWNALDIGAPWNPLRYAMQRHLDRPVQFVRMKPFQVAANLANGRLDFGFLCAQDYLDTRSDFQDYGKPIAVSKVAVRQGLIVARAGSDISTIADLKNKRFAFGPPGDPVLDKAAKSTLEAGGITTNDLQQELVALHGKTILTVNNLQHHISANETAFEIAHGIGTQAGVIEASDYESWPDTGGNVLLRTFSKDQFRILARTDEIPMNTMPAGPVVAAHDADADLVSEVAAFLKNTRHAHRDALMTMGLACFEAPEPDVHQQMQRLVAQAMQ